MRLSGRITISTHARVGFRGSLGRWDEEGDSTQYLTACRDRVRRGEKEVSCHKCHRAPSYITIPQRYLKLAEPPPTHGRYRVGSWKGYNLRSIGWPESRSAEGKNLRRAKMASPARIVGGVVLQIRGRLNKVARSRNPQGSSRMDVRWRCYSTPELSTHGAIIRSMI